MCPGTKPRSRGAFLAVCGLWFVMTPPHSSLSLIVQMCNLHSNQPWIPLTHQTVSRPMQSLTSVLSASGLPDSALRSQSSCSPRELSLAL